MIEYTRYTVASLIAALESLPQDAEVGVEWDGNLSLFEIQTGTEQHGAAVVLYAGWWGDFYDK